MKVFQLDSLVSKPISVNVYCGLAVKCKESRISVCIKDTKGDLAADFKQLDGLTVSENSFHSCISKDNEGDAEKITGTSSRHKTCDAARYPLYRIRFNGLPWKGYDSLQTFGIDDLFSDQPVAKRTGYADSSSADSSDLESLDLYYDFLQSSSVSESSFPSTFCVYGDDGEAIKPCKNSRYPWYRTRFR